MEVRFYHFEKTSLEKGCARLLERVLGAGQRAVLYCADKERLAHLDTVLWTYSSAAFLPHGTEKDGYAKDQPIWLTDKWENPNGADLVVILDADEVQDDRVFTRCLDIFDGSHDSALEKARTRWRLYRERGYHLAYWKQNAQGEWETPQARVQTT
ncbi:MAG: DNA polymerase III subunit chi [Alphaproteobacteria bacterium]|jgi:DNA polymerase-3 subunit chi|nr:DNA polymerase III subunit chi [Alphaproteobacteria bacterium]